VKAKVIKRLERKEKESQMISDVNSKSLGRGHHIEFPSLLKPLEVVVGVSSYLALKPEIQFSGLIRFCESCAVAVVECFGISATCMRGKMPSQ